MNDIVFANRRGQHLAEMTGYHRSTVIKGILEMEIDGFLKLEERYKPDGNRDTNLITLCESGHNGINCHLGVGHLGSFKSYNKDVESDSLQWNKKITTRPTS